MNEQELKQEIKELMEKKEIVDKESSDIRKEIYKLLDDLLNYRYK